MKFVKVIVVLVGLSVADPAIAFQSTFRDNERANRDMQNRLREGQQDTQHALERLQDQTDKRRQNRSDNQPYDPAPSRPSAVDTKIAPDVGKMIAAGDCRGAYNYALAMGAFDTAMKAQQVCERPAPAGPPAAN